MGQLHGGFTAAGICYDEPLIDLDWENSQRQLNINVLGTAWTAKLIAKHLVETKTPGSIVFVASLSAQGLHIPVQYVTIYNAAKAAVKGMVGPLAVELGRYGIRVNSISPGKVVAKYHKKPYPSRVLMVICRLHTNTHDRRAGRDEPSHRQFLPRRRAVG